ncbi:DarT ssDNA thymidine ADP-ribosyltransferase family protein [Picosynechococcus sp. PCC 7117]|uniref:DarT ssDNA thymidine ADP-ribosyltransferase family protein n=1 Tax=Picosynechococcus sp. PCC 7117 TaxID=195498 RepID=UPI000810D477|nr:DarT ssDNA thymidine ADP-ribosyltransferase family protein [Picosynechococcus sp. PCC 7117]ANV86914.1 hypothetical protein AWQ22_05210 [Picosynechococcus sp. PCC 7117]
MINDAFWSALKIMDEIIRKYNIDSVWHFTDKANIQSIKDNGGLLSHAELQSRGIQVPAPGGNQWSHDADLSKGLNQYVHLCFLKEHPMHYCATEDGRIKSSAWLKIKIDVLKIPGVRYCADVSNKSGVPILDANQAAEQIDFEVLYSRLDWGDPKVRERRNLAKKSEILVPKSVPLDYIIYYVT